MKFKIFHKNLTVISIIFLAFIMIILIGTELIDLKDSYRSAMSVIRKSAEIMGSLMVYEQMKLKLMVLSSDAEVLQGIVQGELKNLVTEENCVMYETLQAYLKQNCNKQRTAE